MASPPPSARSVRISLISYGHANGPIVQQQNISARYHKTLPYSIRHLPNPPRHLRAKATGLSRRLQKEFLQNDDVETFLLKVRGEILNVVKNGGDQLLATTEEQDENENREEGSEDADLSEQPSQKGTEDIDIVVTICCEEGRHRSVAFVEELARRLAELKNGDDKSSQHWHLAINVLHRDIGGNDEDEQSLGQNNRPNKAQAKARQRDRREKEDRHKLQLGDEVVVS